MASPERSNRKILRAKKTMPTSCRKQVEILTKSKNIEALKATTIGNNVPRYNQNLSAGIIESKCTRSEKDVSSLDSSKNVLCSPKSEVFPQNLVEPVKEIIGSKIRLECISEQVVDPYQKPGNIIASPRKLFPQEAKDSQNTCENHSEYQANVTRSFFEQHEGDCHLNSIYSPSRVLSSIVQMPKYTVTSTLDDQRSVKMVSYLETDSNSESHDKRQNDILCSDTCFMPIEKAPNVVNSISSSCHAANILKTEDSSRTCYSSISTCGSRDSMWHSSLDNTDNSYSHNQKKRMFSENKENVKRTKTSEQINENICLALEKQRTLLEQVKRLIQQEICSINYKVFDHKLKELNERIGKTQCRHKHEAIADELFARIAKLQRRIKTVLSQRNSLEPNMLSSNTDCEVTSSETMYMDKIQESVNSPNEKMTSMNYEPSKPPEKASAKTNLSLGHVETVSESNNDDVMLISVASPNLKTSIASNPTDIGKIKSRNSSDLPDAEPEIMSIEKKKLDPVIDLTKEGLSNCNTESPVSTLESPVKFVLNSKETTPVAQNAAQILESFEHLPPLPEPPPPLPELVDKIRDTLPPQKPELKVKRVLRPRGIALTWNITKINPKCAPVESYHLFLCHESPNNKLIWKKIGEIKALPLPMACTVSQFLSSNKYYFTVQSKDIFGRYGPFCDIKSIPGFSENLT